MPTYGLEEEVFVTEPDKPSLQSLYYLAKLLWKNPKYYYIHTASNFARGSDIRQGLMSGIEIATDLHSEVNDLLADLTERRKDLCRVCEGLIVPLGHLINYDAPTNTCAFQIHIGEVKSQEKVYRNLVHFLPLLTLLTVNSPYVNGKYFGQSYRISTSFAIGTLREDPEYRFQDIIIARRLGTIEIRIFDSIWDLNRLTLLIKAIDLIVKSDFNIKIDIIEYNKLRNEIAHSGYSTKLDKIYQKLRIISDIPVEPFRRTPSDEVRDFYDKNGLLKTYSALDNAYRNGQFQARQNPAIAKSVLKMGAGVLGYYILKLPYITWKYWREWH